MSRRWLLAAVATVLAAGLAVALLEAGVAIGHRYTTVHAAFTSKTRTQTRTHTRTETRTATVTSRPVVVVTHPDVIVTRPFARPSTVTVTRPAPPPVTVTETITETAASFSQ